MTKVTIDSFDTEEQAVAFVDWFRRNSSKIKLITTQGVYSPEWDGVDHYATDDSNITVNIAVYEEDTWFSALVAQLVEAMVLEAIQCQFESDRGYQYNSAIGAAGWDAVDSKSTTVNDTSWVRLPDCRPKYYTFCIKSALILKVGTVPG